MRIREIEAVFAAVQHFEYPPVHIIPGRLGSNASE
jgi:hypothetical protein